MSGTLRVKPPQNEVRRGVRGRGSAETWRACGEGPRFWEQALPRFF